MQYISGEWKDGWVHKTASAVRQPECSSGAQTAPGIVSFKKTLPNQICNHVWALLLIVARRKNYLTPHWNGARIRRRWWNEQELCAMWHWMWFSVWDCSVTSRWSPLCPCTRDSSSVPFPLLVSESRSEWALHLSPLAELISWCIPPRFGCARHQRKMFERIFFWGMSRDSSAWWSLFPKNTHRIW